jgi:hypothetical protein
MLPLRRSSAHSRIDTRDQEEVEPGQEREEGREVRLAALEQLAERKREQVREQQEDDQYDECDRSREVTRELATQDMATVFKATPGEKGSGGDGAEHVFETARRRAGFEAGRGVVRHELAFAMMMARVQTASTSRECASR